MFEFAGVEARRQKISEESRHVPEKGSCLLSRIYSEEPKFWEEADQNQKSAAEKIRINCRKQAGTFRDQLRRLLSRSLKASRNKCSRSSSSFKATSLSLNPRIHRSVVHGRYCSRSLIQV